MRPFRANVPEAELTELRRRITATRFPEDDFDISVPAAVSVFPEEVYQAPRSWTERAYHNLVHVNALAKGGHFAAWEQPQLFSEEVRTASGRCADSQ
jgi:hypothetical protein